MGIFLNFHAIGVGEATVSSREIPNLAPYIAECNDIIEALNTNDAEGNAFKAIWRRAAAQNHGPAKQR